MAELIQPAVSGAPVCAVHEAPKVRTAENRAWWVTLLTLVMMIVELVVGTLTKSMALTADGWHMATHVGALGLTALAYWYARTRAGETRFAFGTGKVYALSGYTSAVLLLGVAVYVCWESISRLITPESIGFNEALPVAIIGLMVNLASVAILGIGNDGHDHGHSHAGHDHAGHSHAGHDHSAHDGHDHSGHDHGKHDHHTDQNMKAAYLHVVADAATSVLAIIALVAGRWLHVRWLDPAVGIVGGLLIAQWGIGLTAECARQLVDLHPVEKHKQAVRAALEALQGTQVCDLHLWSVGPGKLVCVVSVITAEPRELDVYREAVLAAAPIAHLTIEVRGAQVAALA